MNIAILHSFMDNIGGAEMVTLTLARELNAHIYTTNINKDHIIEMGFQDVLPRIISIGKVPLQAPFRHQITSFRFRRLNLSKRYNYYIISGDWAMSGGVNNHPNIWYVHSPLHELWELKGWIRKNIVSALKRPFYDVWVLVNRILTLKYSRYIDTFVSNSKNTKERIKKYYKKDAVVIYPPIYTDKYSSNTSKDYWLSVNRLLKNKRIEIQLDTFRKMPEENLIIVGSYEKSAIQFESYKSELESIKPSNVTIVSWVDDKELKSLYSECKGLITTAMKEDFGMTAVEAMASGKPVIAPNEGGYKESIIDGANGILIDDIDADKLSNAIRNINRKLNLEGEPFNYSCVERSREFDTTIFIEKIKEVLNNGNI